MIDTAQDKTERRLRSSAACLLIGLGIQFVTLLINHPLAFLAFALVGSPLVLAGAALYLWSVVIHGERSP
jgi:hypothetical protein